MSEPTLLDRQVVGFRLPGRRRTLHLADLTGDSLKRMGLNNDVSASSDYAPLVRPTRYLAVDAATSPGREHVLL